MKYNIYWTDMHSNIHHEDIDKLDLWVDHVRSLLDFWPIAYYPYYVRITETGFGLEDKHDDKKVLSDWNKVIETSKKVNSSNFPMFIGYEWQGRGLDGDHNIYFLDDHGEISFCERYKELIDLYKDKDVIGIPHHMAYSLGNRGKNWETHNEKFSPFAEVYSSHGSSENDHSSIDMRRHIHMGPRTGETSLEVGLNLGHKVGIIASGDNHSCPAVYGFGLCAVLSKSNKKEDIWDAFINRRVYGVSKDRIELDFKIDNGIMGSTIETSEFSNLRLKIKASNAIDRVEIISNNVVTEMIHHDFKYELNPIEGKIRFKFQLELGWGPDRKYFPDIDKKLWMGKLSTTGKIISIEKCWSTFGQRLYDVNESSCQFELTTYKSTATGKWMGPSAVTTEGFIFEIEDEIDNDVKLTINGVDYVIPIKKILDNSILYGLTDESKKLL